MYTDNLSCTFILRTNYPTPLRLKLLFRHATRLQFRVARRLNAARLITLRQRMGFSSHDWCLETAGKWELIFGVLTHIFVNH